MSCNEIAIRIAEATDDANRNDASAAAIPLDGSGCDFEQLMRRSQGEPPKRWRANPT